ncbi:MAG: SsrA-binding protein [Chloroflexi bacterium CG07_land_8_20_14_0_80_51_10]|nr:MAG: SsrA-binding protein [Chloroflexi bacterium CG07_land_8_20_14_0_80_51_10]
MKFKTITVNRKAYHDYLIEDSMEAGLVLTGTEIKSIRQGQVNIRDAYARPENGELWLLNCHIAQYKEGNRYNHEPTRPRKLLLHKREIAGLSSDVARKGLTLVPLKLYLKNGHAKVEIGLAKGKKLHDKRRSIIQRETERELAQAVKSRQR